MKDKIELSIGLITYNHENYISDAIKGLLSQSIDAELIILDDASKDKTVDIIESYRDKLEKKYSTIKSIFHKNNTGNISKNVNEMIVQAEGKYIWLIAGDDIMLPNASQKLMDVLERETECFLVYGNMIGIEDDYRYGDAFDAEDVILKNQKEGIQENLFNRLMMGNCIPAPTVMMKRSLFDTYGLHDENIIFEDYEYWLRLSRSKNFYFVNIPVVLYRNAVTSVANKSSDKDFRRLRTRIEVDYMVKDKYDDYLSQEYRDEVWKNYFNYCMLLCKNANYREGIELVNSYQKKKNVYIDDNRQSDYKVICERLNIESDLFEKWVSGNPDSLHNYINNICEIKCCAVYGFARLGRALCNYLERYGIQVKYIIDQKGSMLDTDRTVYTLNDNLEKVDAIFVTPLGLYNEIKIKLEKKVDCKILNFEKILNEM